MAKAQGIRAGRAFVELGVSDQLTAGLRRAQRQLQAFGQGLRAIGTRVTAAAFSVLAPLAGSARLFASAGDALDKMAARTGVSAEALSELGFAAEQSGADLETLETGLRVMQRTLADAARGSKSVGEALGLLNLSAEALHGLSPERQFKLIAERISRIEDPTLRAALAMELLGRSGTRLLPLLKDGAKGIEQLQQQARDLGLTISSATARDAAVLTDALNVLRRVLRQSVFAIGAALGPTIVAVSQRVTRTVVAVTDWIRQNQALIVSVLKVATAVAAGGIALIALGLAISTLATVLGGLATIGGAVAAALGMIGSAIAAMLSPIGLAVTAVAGLGTALLAYTGAGADALAWLGAQFGRLRETVSKVVGGISDTLAAGDITLAAQTLWLALKLTWQEGVAALNRTWLEAKRFFIGTAQAMGFGALAAAQQVFHALEIAWIETTALLSKTWTNFTSDLRQAWGAIHTWLTQRWLDLMKLFGRLTDAQAAAAQRMADQEFSDSAAEVEQRRAGALSERAQRRQREREQAAALNQATLAEIGRQFEQAQRALDADTDAKSAETQRQLAEARQALDQALAEAKRKREESEAGGPPRRRPGDPLAGLEERIASLSDLLARRISVSGTFNPAAAAGLGIGNAEERTARHTEQIAKHTKRLADAAVTGGLTFT